MHVVDVAGVGPVHLVGGMSALIAAIMVKPRYGRFTDKKEPEPDKFNLRNPAVIRCIN
jgi:ammonia channel protein AmtB